MAGHAGLQRLPLPPASSVPAPGGATRPPHPGTEKPSGVCLGRFTGRRRSVALHERVSAATSPVRCVQEVRLFCVDLRKSQSETCDNFYHQKAPVPLSCTTPHPVVSNPAVH